MVPGVWEIFRANCTVILRYCKSKSGRKCKSYCTLKHQRILNLQFAQFFKGLKRGLLTKIRCSLCLQGMVLDGLKGFQAKKSKSMTFNYKSCISYLVLAQWEPLLDSFNSANSAQIWIFFLNRSEFYQESNSPVSCKVWFVIWSQINKRWLSPKNEALWFGQNYFWTILGVPNNM